MYSFLGERTINLIMKKIKLFILTLGAALSVAACDSEDYGAGVQGPANLMTFEFVGDEPIVAAPDEEVFYSLKVSYAKGLASMSVSLDGEQLEGSLMTWEDAPLEAEYNFNYLVKGSQFGQTLDFVFTATGVDGYRQSVDYPLWITANDVEFIVALPENLPTEIYSNENVSCEVSLACGNVLKSLIITKNGADYDSKTDFGNTEKTFKYPFVYTPSQEDINKDVTFHFVATDVKGNVAEAYYTVTVHKADVVVKELYSETFNTTMSISGTTAFNTTIGGVTGGRATEFVPANVGRYASLMMQDPEAEEGVMIPRPGALEGCSVYDNDLSSLVYTIDGTEVCLSKNAGSGLGDAGTYLWYRRGIKSGDPNYNQGKGWLRVDGIKLHGATSLKLSYNQLTASSKFKVEYSIDNGASWTEVIATATKGNPHDVKFVIASAAETISLKFSENLGTAHACIDDIKLVEVQ